MSDQPVFDIRDLAVSYDGRTVLRDVSFQVEKNRVTAIIGPSGCGKSTFIRCLNRMNDLVPGAKVGGTILYQGANIYGGDVDVTLAESHVAPHPKSPEGRDPAAPRRSSGGDALVAAGILEPERPLAFVHPLVRAGVYEELGVAERSLAHRRAAELMELSGAALARTLGVSEASVSRLVSGARTIDPKSKEGELALLLVRVYRSLDALVGSDPAQRKTIEQPIAALMREATEKIAAELEKPLA
jgi:ABC-type cobalamin/Fe3+-siderophores transport system ATPase subunit